MIAFDHPLLLLGLLLVPLTLLLARQRLARMTRRRRLLILLARAAVLAALVASLAAPFWLSQTYRVSVAFVLDASAASSPATAAWLTSALHGLHSGDSAILVSNAQPPRLLSARSNARALLRALPTDAGSGSDLPAAVRLAVGLLPSDGSGRVVVLSVGTAVRTSLDALAGVASANHIPLDVGLLPSPNTGVALEQMRLASRARQGDVLPLSLVVSSPSARTASLLLSTDGQAAPAIPLALHAGINDLVVRMRAGQMGAHTLRATIALPGGAPAINQSLSAGVVIDPPAHLLLVSSGGASALTAALGGGGARLTVVDPSALPATAAGLATYDAVVLDNVPASALSPAQVAALTSAVRDRGRGLLVVGGPSAYSGGHYTHSALENLLPVWSVPPAHLSRSSLALQLVLDKSGSMSELEHGVSKMSMVQKAADLALSHLHADDSMGVVAFDDTNHWLVPMHTVGDAARQASARAAIATLQAGGDTMIYPALQSAYAAVLHQPATARHIILVTDGQGEAANFDALVRTIHSHDITLSTIGVGSDADLAFLHRLAVEGGGRFYHTNDPHDIPNIFVLETRLSGGPPVILGHVPVGVASDSPLLRALVGNPLPAVQGYDLAVTKDSAQTVLETAVHDPLLATWRYGLGRVTTWMSSATPQWAGAWSVQAASATPAIAAFWGDLASWVVPADTQDTLHPTFALSDSGLTLSVDTSDGAGHYLDLAQMNATVTLPTGGTLTLPLMQVAPGLYAATLPQPTAGTYRAVVQAWQDRVSVGGGQTAVAVPYPSIDNPAQAAANQAALLALATQTGGSQLATPQQAFDHGGLPAQTQRTDLWQGAALLGLLLFPLDVALRVLSPTPLAYRHRSPPIV